MSEVYVDFQGFLNKEKFVFKELAIISEDYSVNLHCLFKPPHNISQLNTCERQIVKWLTKNHHGLKWQNGDQPYEELVETLTKYTKKANVIFVKGSAKEEILQNYIPHKTVLNLEDYEFPCLAELMSNSTELQCDHHEYNNDLHDKKLFCAKYIANCMMNYHNEHRRPRDMFEEDVYDDDEERITCRCICK